ncbi:MAG: DNA methyltransferase [Pseudomonadota bacterium]|jgi:DNA modification methylase|nr:DNA methyltransferase [Pseudomonadota bacterium]
MTERRYDNLTQFVRQYGKPYSTEYDEYEKLPYDKPVVAGKNTPIYNAHSYHTKVPYQGIIPFIEHYSEPGDLILDPFCGTGMTGVAALLAPSGPRRVILNDLSPAAVHIARNYCTPCDVDELKKEFERIKAAVKEEFDWLYETYHEDPETGEKIPATIQYTIWSDVYQCLPKKRDIEKHHVNPGGCGREIVLWDVAVDTKSGQVKDTFTCPQCGETWKKTELNLVRSIPVITNYIYIDPKKKKPRRAEHRVTDFELQRLKEIEYQEIPYWYPTDAFDDTREMWRGIHRDQGITRACDFYTKRNLWALARLWEETNSIEDERTAKMVRFAITGTMQGASRMNRHKPNFTASILMGTLYVGSFIEEANVLRLLSPRIEKTTQLAKTIPSEACTSVACLHAGKLDQILADSVDYIFTDPPFGSNIFYGDCSFLWESWLQEFTDDSLEAVWNKSRKPSEGGKTLEDYKRLMAESFREMYRVLKPNRWATVVFSNSDDRVWEAIQDAAHEAGFVIYGGREFDKVQRSFKGIKGEKGQEKVISKDVLLNLHKPKVPQVRNSELKRVDDVEGYILHQIKMYFQYLSPKAPTSERTVEAITRAVQRRVLEEGCSMQGFSAGFVSDVLHKAGTKRSLVEHEGAWYPANGWLGEVIVRNEASAVLWLTGLLSKEERRFDEIDPLWKQARLKGNYKGVRGLEELLDEFFIQNPDGTYRVPDEHERQVLKGQEEERGLRECERFLSGKLNREPSIDEKFAWIEMLASRKEWNSILALEQTLSANLGWHELPEGKAASDRLRYAKFATKKGKEKELKGEQPTLF